MKFTREERIFMVKRYYIDGCSGVINAWNDEFDSQPPSRQQIRRTALKFENEGSIVDAPRSGRPRSARTPDNMERVATALVETPATSTRVGARDLDLSRTSYRRILRELKFKCYHPRLIHALNEDDFDRRMEFCTTMLEEYEANDPHIFENVLWTDEATFTLSGQVNRHNCVYWDTENHHRTSEVALTQPGLNVWGGFSRNGIYGPYIFDGTVTGETYHAMLTDYLLPGLQALPGFNNLWYQHDGAPPHYSLVARNFLDETFGGRVIGRRGQIEWPARSPDLTVMDFYFWGVVKDFVYARKPRTLPELEGYIYEAFADIENSPQVRQVVIDSIPERLQDCLHVEGHQFEYLR